MAIRTAFHTLPTLPVSDANAQKWAKYAWSWIATGDIRDPSGNTTGALNYSNHVALGDQVRAYNPRHKMGWYIGGAAGQWFTDPLYAMLEDKHVLHAPDGRPLTGPVLPPNGNPAKLINLHSPDVQKDIIAFLIQKLKDNKWEGILVDSFSELAFITWVTTYMSSPTGCLEGPAHTQAWWEQAMGQFGDRLTWACEQQGYKLYGVGLAPGLDDPTRAWAGYGASGMTKHLSGLMYEAPHHTMGNPIYLDQALSATRLVTYVDKDIFWSVSPMLDVIPQDAPFRESFKDYHLGVYLLIQEKGTTYGYWPYEPYRETDWNGTPYIYWDTLFDTVADLGVPLAQYESQGAIRFRRYQEGIVLVNCTNINLTFVSGVGATYRLWDRVTGTIIQSGNIVIPPYNSYVLWNV